jgi:hypothetical protein
MMRMRRRISGALFSLLMSTVVVGGCTLLCCCLCYDTLYYVLVCCSVFDRDLRGSMQPAMLTEDGNLKKKHGDDMMGSHLFRSPGTLNFKCSKKKVKPAYTVARDTKCKKCRRRADENPSTSTAPLNSNPALVITLVFFSSRWLPVVRSVAAAATRPPPQDDFC